MPGEIPHLVGVSADGSSRSRLILEFLPFHRAVRILLNLDQMFSPGTKDATGGSSTPFASVRHGV